MTNKKCLLIIFSAALLISATFLLSLSGCHAISGIGKDLVALSSHVQEAIEPSPSPLERH